MPYLVILSWLITQPGNAELSEEQSARATAVVSVPGTAVALHVPPGFVIAREFAGFLYEDASASILVTEVPGGFDEVAAGFGPGSAMLEGMEVLERETARLDERPALLLKVRQQGQHATFLKWVVVSGSDTRSLVLTAAFPEELADPMSDMLRDTLLHARWDPAKAVDYFEGLPYRVETGPLLQVAARSGDMLVLTPDGRLPDPDTLDAILTISEDRVQFTIKDRGAYARDRLESIIEEYRPKLVRRAAMHADGLEGELLVMASGDGVEAPLIFFQALLFDGSRYYAFEGSANEELAPAYMDAFEVLARSFARNDESR